MQPSTFQPETHGRIVEPLMCTLPGGAFLMGDAHGRADEQPVHEVVVDPFALAIYPVTNAEYAVFLQETAHTPPVDWGRPRFDHPRAPVCGVSWDDAMAYIAWLSGRTHRPYCLPTEAQREYAARGGRVQQAYPWGNDSLPLEGVYARGLEGPLTGGPLVCGEGPAGPNDFGIYHLADNVHEWCADYYDPHYYRHSPSHNPPGPVPDAIPDEQNAPAALDRRSARGGSWRHDIKYSRCAARSSLAPHKRFADFGFRLALRQEVQLLP